MSAREYEEAFEKLPESAKQMYAMRTCYIGGEVLKDNELERCVVQQVLPCCTIHWQDMVDQVTRFAEGLSKLQQELGK